MLDATSMAWKEKQLPTPFDNQTITGLWMLDGDLMAKQYSQPRLSGKKYPLIQFPSMRDYALEHADLAQLNNIESDQIQPKSDALHLFGGVHIPLHASGRDILDLLVDQATESGILVSITGSGGLRLKTDSDLNSPEYLIDFDQRTDRITNVRRLPEYAIDLMPEEIRAALPPLYSTEGTGNSSIAVAKYFTPDATWTWYATEFDGRDIFFGLVDGFEMELGYFSLKELECVRGQFTLPVERDLYFEPQPLINLI